jgi:carbamoyltransferase
LEEHAQDYFEAENFVNQYLARYMLIVLPFKENVGGQLKAVNHMGTGRLQTIREEWNPRYYRVIKKFGEATGTPVLLNTSFNLRGEPIVNTPQNAFNTFQASGIDLLVMENFLVKK